MSSSLCVSIYHPSIAIFIRLEAQILKLDVVEGRVQRIFVHYKGYPPKYDEWLEVSSPRIAPLHTHTNLPPTNYDIRPRIGSLVDAQDTLGDWCVGRIQDFNPVHRMYLVHYVGWSPRYDEVNPSNLSIMS